MYLVIILYFIGFGQVGFLYFFKYSCVIAHEFSDGVCVYGWLFGLWLVLIQLENETVSRTLCGVT